MKTTTILIVIAAILFFIAGCGPGEPFEIEGQLTPETTTSTHVVASK